MSPESSPLWVWIAIGLLVAGSMAYAASAFLVEYLMAAQ
jgi:hypothetical protein